MDKMKVINSRIGLFDLFKIPRKVINQVQDL